MASEDIIFCANKNCEDMECRRNQKHIKLAIPHSFSLFEQCENWDADGAEWLLKQIPEWVYMDKEDRCL